MPLYRARQLDHEDGAGHNGQPQTPEEMGASLLSPCPPRFGKSVLFAKAAPAGHRSLALRNYDAELAERYGWINRARRVGERFSAYRGEADSTQVVLLFSGCT